jgi:hypothetical protein
MSQHDPVIIESFTVLTSYYENDKGNDKDGETFSSDNSNNTNDSPPKRSLVLFIILQQKHTVINISSNPLLCLKNLRPDIKIDL